MEKIHRPPKIFVLILERIIQPQDRETLPGDFDEMYYRISEESGIARAFFWYLFHVIKLIPPLISNTVLWSVIMIRDFFKIAFRSMLRQKLNSVIKIVGLAIGIACTLLIALFIRDELSFDRFHEKGDRIYRLTTNFHKPDGSIDWIKGAVLFPHGPAMEGFFPEVKHSVRVWQREFTVKSQNVIANESITLVDESFFEVFSFPLIRGNSSTVLSGLNSLVFTETSAKKYFGDEDPVGKTLTLIHGEYSGEFVVTGVAEDAPHNSTVQFTMLIQFETLGMFGSGEQLTRWRGWSDGMQTYVEVEDENAEMRLMDRYPAFAQQYYPHVLESWRFESSDAVPLSFGLQKMTNIHINPGVKDFPVLILVYILTGGIAFIILFIACVNFMTLSIGSAARRSVEIGIRKVLGAERRMLIRRFLIESVVMTGVAVVLGLLFVALVLPVFNELTLKSMDSSSLFSLFNILMLFSLTLIVGITAGSYPGLVMSRFRPVEIFKGKFRLSGKNFFTNTLIVVQFALSVFLIVSAIVMGKQIDYLVSRDLNFNKEGIVVIQTQMRDVEESTRLLRLFRSRLEQRESILSISGASLPFSRGVKTDVIEKDGERFDLDVVRVDHDFFRTMEGELVQGRDFFRDFSSDESDVIVNETLVKRLRIEDPVGKPFEWYRWPMRIIGVIKDTPLEHRGRAINPAIYFTAPRLRLGYIFARISPQDIPGAMEILRSTWKELRPDRPFVYSFLDEDIETQYRNEIRIGHIVRYSSVLAVFIACLGVFGLTSITAARRSKEIGIRKVHGASVFTIVSLISKESIRWVLVANIVAWPVAWYAMEALLQNFAARITISPLVFFLSGFITLSLVLVTVCYHTIRAAHTNPVEVLRYE